MLNVPKNQRLTISEPQVNANPLIIKDLKKIYRKILANIMIKNEPRALYWVNELKERNIKQVGRDQELAWLDPWPCTLIESAEALGTNQVRNGLMELT